MIKERVNQNLMIKISFNCKWKMNSMDSLDILPFLNMVINYSKRILFLIYLKILLKTLSMIGHPLYCCLVSIIENLRIPKGFFVSV